MKGTASFTKRLKLNKKHLHLLVQITCIA